MPCWPGDPPVALTPVATLAREGYFLRELRISEHGGTHVNAPASFVAGGMAIADYPAAGWVRSAVVIAARSPAQSNPDWVLDVATVRAWEAEHGPIPAGSVVLVDTGWGDRWGDPAAFLNADAAGRLHFPGIDPETAQWLLDERAIAGVGTDTPGVDPGWSQDFATNQRVLARQGIVIECVANLDQVPPVGATLAIGVLPLVGGSGAPAAILAFCPLKIDIQD
jgi:kynurenine formamidase